MLLLVSVSFLRQKLQGKLLSTAGTHPHFTQRVSDHVFVANSLSIYFPTNLIHLDSEVFFIFSPADITMSEIKSSFPSSSLCYIQVNYQIYYRKCAALIQTPSQAIQQSPECFAELGALASQGWKAKLTNHENVSPVPSRHLQMCGLERKTKILWGKGEEGWGWRAVLRE